jgi:hypothetical protein
MHRDAINSNNIRLLPVEEELHGELSDRIYYQCQFCEKQVGLQAPSRKICEKLSGNQFFCTFCLRNQFYTADNRHILALSFRGIIGYYYYALYNTKRMWLSEISDYASEHEKAGLENPVFHYDHDTFMWFIDFRKIGRGRRKIRLNDTLKSIVSILSVFNIYHHAPSVKLHKIYGKFEEAIIKFHSERYRPEGKRLLIPTLSGCIQEVTKNLNMEDTRYFLPQLLKSK